MEPWGTWFPVSGGCPKPPRNFIGRTPSFSSCCWGETFQTTSGAVGLLHNTQTNIKLFSLKTRKPCTWFRPQVSPIVVHGSLICITGSVCRCCRFSYIFCTKMLNSRVPSPKNAREEVERAERLGEMLRAPL